MLKRKRGRTGSRALAPSPPPSLSPPVHPFFPPPPILPLFPVRFPSLFKFLDVYFPSPRERIGDGDDGERA